MPIGLKVAELGTQNRMWTALAQAAALLVPAAAILALFGGGSQASLACGGLDVNQTIVGLFKRQLKLTPYARFVDVARADVEIRAVFDVAKADERDETDEHAKTCVAFATYHASLNEAGQHVEGHERIQSSLLDELSGEKQIFYKVKLTPEGRRTVRVSRISG